MYANQGHAYRAGLNAPFGARCFLTDLSMMFEHSDTIRLNAPFGALCFLTSMLTFRDPVCSKVLMYRLAPGTFGPGH